MKAKDQPIPAKIFLSLLNEAKSEDFIGLANSLYLQNLIFQRPTVLRKKDDILDLTITFRNFKSFEKWLENEYIQKHWGNKFEDALSASPKTIAENNVLIEADNVLNCVCQESDFYILQGRTLQFIDELTCNKCLGQVSDSSIPSEISLERWQVMYQRFYLTWLESGLFEKEAFIELTNYKTGKLNLMGEKIRKKLSEYFNIPVYISYFVGETFENSVCVICGNDGIESGLTNPKQICKNCHTIFDYNE